ncbi:MAG: lipopolysaccharide biosynthesis protein [Candidatus Hodarchaeota archaeon]
MSNKGQISKTFFVKIFVALLTFIAGIIIARTLGPTGKGEYTIVMFISGMAVTFGSFNLGDSAIYFANKTQIGIGRIMSTNALFISGASMVYILALCLFSSANLLPWKELRQPHLIFFTCAFIPLKFTRRHVLALLRAKRDFDGYNITAFT